MLSVSLRQARRACAARSLCVSTPRFSDDDPNPGLEMGQRAAAKVNATLDRLGGLYQGQHSGGGAKARAGYERVFGKVTDLRRRGRPADEPHPGAVAEARVAAADRAAAQAAAEAARRERLAAEAARLAALEPPAPEDFVLGEGPLGLEILWTWPPLITGTTSGGQAACAGLEPGSVILRLGDKDVTKSISDAELDSVMAARPLQLTVLKGDVSWRQKVLKVAAHRFPEALAAEPQT